LSAGLTPLQEPFGGGPLLMGLSQNRRMAEETVDSTATTAAKRKKTINAKATSRKRVNDYSVSANVASDMLLAA
jgi:hypothetical protein